MHVHHASCVARAQVQTRDLGRASVGAKIDALRYFSVESGLSLLLVCGVNVAVVSVFASGFYDPGADPPDIGLQNAGVSLHA
jgi:hypothetical protein